MLSCTRPRSSSVQLVVRSLLPLLFALTLAACGRQAPQPELGMTPIAGGMASPAELAISSATAGGTADGASGEVAANAAALLDAATTDSGAEAAVWLPGQSVALTLPAGAALRADAGRNAQALQLYAVGEALQVVEPSGDYGGYPVMADGEAWYRVRAGDGLVGWLPAAALAAGE